MNTNDDDKLNDAELGNLNQGLDGQQDLHPEEMPLNQNVSSRAVLVENQNDNPLGRYWSSLTTDKQIKTICAVEAVFFVTSAGFCGGAYELFKDLRQPTETEWDDIIAVFALVFFACGIVFAVAFVYMLIELACIWSRRNGVRAN